MGARKSISRMFSIFLVVIVLLTGVFPVQAAPVIANDKSGQVENKVTALDSPAIFTDVSSAYWAYSWVMSLYDAGITGGCGTSPLMYCPESTVTRAQMAIFILRGIHGSAYVPPVATGTVFSDVPADAFAADWIEQLAAEGVTGGCGDGNYCPDATITRAQMAIFLLRGEHGNAYTPPVATGTVFTDVPTDAFAADWIEQLASEGVTSGCGGGNYCPDANVTRAEMAVFLVRAFSLPITTLSPIIPSTTKALPSTTTQYLTSVSSDGSTYTFSKTTTELSTLAPGEIMAGDASPAAPYGFLRKVTSVSSSSGKVIVQTQPTTIEEAIQQGEVAVSQTLSPANATSATFADGVQPMDANPMAGGIYLQLSNVVLYDQDGNENTTNDQINANGSVGLEPKFDFKLKVQDYQLKELYFTMTASQTTQLKIASKVSVTAKAEKVLATYPMGPLFLTIGPFPVTVYPVVTIAAGIDGTISANVSTGVTQTLTETAGVSYANNSWSPIQEFSNQFQYDAPALTTGVAIKAYTGAKLKILLYGSVGPDISLNAYLKLENSLQTSSWTLYGGLEVPVGISIDIFSHVIAGYSAVVIDYRILLAQAGTGVTVSGVVYYSVTPLANVYVELIAGDNPLASPTFSTTTNSSGSFVFSSVPAGKYSIKGYGPTSEYVGWVGYFVFINDQDVQFPFYLPKWVKLVSPLDKSTITSLSPKFCWNGLPEAKLYYVQLYKYVSGNWTLIEPVETTVATCYTTSKILQKGVEYEWGITATDQFNNWIGSSTVFRFTIASP